MSEATSARSNWSLVRLWNEFFHEPADPHVCALIRIAYGSLMLVYVAVLWPDVTLWYGEHGVLPVATAHAMWGDMRAFRWSVLDWLPPGDLWLQVYIGVFFVQAVCLLTGFGSRFNAICTWIWLISFQNRNTLITDGEDKVFHLVGLYLIFMPLGHAWSLDSLLRKRWNLPALTPASGWAVTLLQIQMALIYMSAAIMKMTGEAWLNGTAMYYVSRLDDYFGRFPTPRFLFDSPMFVALFTWSVIAVEFCVPLLIWFKETRLVCLALVLLFHVGCDYTMNLFLFQWIMLVGWMSFLTPGDLSIFSRRKSLAQ